MKEDTKTPEDERLYTAKEMADCYLEGFKDGYHKALDEVQEIKTDPGPNYG